MLDAHFIRDHLDAVKANCKNRNVTPTSIASSPSTTSASGSPSETQRAAAAERDPKLSRKEKDPAKKQALIAEGEALREQVGDLESAAQAGRGRPARRAADHPQHDPPGRPGRRDAGRQQGHPPLGRAAEVRLHAKDHVALAEALDLVDFEAGSAVAGQKFYFLKNEAVLLELALVQYAMRHARCTQGYTPVITPDLARVEVLEGIGFMPAPTRRRRSTASPTPTCA